jgi:RNA polymerase sigma factor for flagellar operon FliA
VDVDDLISSAVMGLIEAIDRYDSTRAVPFETYAKHRIHGAVVDALRSSDWVPRSVRRKGDLIEMTRASQTRTQGRSPTRPEMATALNITPAKYDAMVTDSEIRTLLSLDAPVGTDNPTPLIEQVAGTHNLMAKWQNEERKVATIDAIQNLPERERTAIALYYLHELSLKEVGQVLNVTESRACQLCSQGVKRLRVRLKSFSS